MILAIDLGTTTCKVIAIDELCTVVDKETLEYSFSTPRPSWAEQDPSAWWIAVAQCLKAVASRIDASAVKAIGLSGQMHGLVALDAKNEVLRPAILWNDQRAQIQCSEVYEKVGGRDRLLGLTNNAMLPGYIGGKLLWMKAYEPALYDRIKTVLLPKDYIRFLLTGEIATDVSDASGTGLFDVRSRTWSRPLIDRIGIPADILPACTESGAVAGTVKAALADELGLKRGLRVVAGGGDAVIQTVGAGTLSERDVLAIIGTGGNVTMTSQTCPSSPSPSTQTFCHVVPGKWVTMGVTLNAGSSLKWFRDSFGYVGNSGTASSYALLDAEASASPAGSNGVVFLPYLQGERCPHTDVNARACYIGVGIATRRSDFIRSTMEGVSFSLLDALNTVRPGASVQARLVVSGGGANSPLWRQILADVFDSEVVTKKYGGEASALGAGIVAGASVGVWRDIDDGARLIAQCDSTEPIKANAERYRKIFDVYRNLYTTLSGSFDALASID